MKMVMGSLWILILFLWASLAGAQEKLTLCSADSPPWTIKTGSSPSEIKGLAVDLMLELFRRADAQVEMVALPFKRCLDNTRSGELDGCFMTIKNAERESYAEFSEPYLSIPTYVYYSSERFGCFEWKRWEDFKPYRLGVQRGFKYGREFTEALKRHRLKVVEISDVAEGVGMLLLDRVDFVLTNEFRYDYLMQTHPQYQGRLSRSYKPIAVGRVYIAISKRSPNVAIIPKLNRILGEMRDDGTISRIVGQN
ncbi:transporter substrate-binding domain-containing protein [uncultured Pseudodesulfovibrio sp.]|uniref:substrate-binding periplasmic protein n=1 Tax=uncultured Pseudodesulfovibrio sp. TaxID=2035858 RepID=UPI0029C8488E|nr:transporter substrate-binding domain-containing protein [uncultured Pseudodesulfovibrio sp.]